MNKILVFICVVAAAILSSCSMESTLTGKWKIEDASVTVRNGRSFSPDHSELGEITFDEDGTFVSSGIFGLTDSHLEYLGDDKYYSGLWDCHESQMKINGALWDVNIISEERIELRACVEEFDGKDVIKDYYCLLIKQ